jgi:hypothetical protein
MLSVGQALTSHVLPLAHTLRIRQALGYCYGLLDYIIAIPPFTCRVCPVTYEASADARYTAAAAMSLP